MWTTQWTWLRRRRRRRSHHHHHRQRRRRISEVGGWEIRWAAAEEEASQEKIDDYSDCWVQLLSTRNNIDISLLWILLVTYSSEFRMLIWKSGRRRAHSLASLQYFSNITIVMLSDLRPMSANLRYAQTCVENGANFGSDGKCLYCWSDKPPQRNWVARLSRLADRPVNLLVNFNLWQIRPALRPMWWLWLFYIESSLSLSRLIWDS